MEMCSQNNPLFIKVFSETEEPLTLNYVVHTALDVFEEKGPNPTIPAHRTQVLTHRICVLQKHKD